MGKLIDKIKAKLNSGGKLSKKFQLVIAGLLAVIMLIIFIKSFKPKFSALSYKNEENNQTSQNAETDYVTGLETRLTTILSSIKGVENVKVFIMTESSVKKVYAVDEDKQLDSDGKSGKYKSEIVFEKDGSSSNPVVSVEVYPEITGVLIVADGVNDEKLRLMVINAVAVALNIQNSKIEVLSGKSK